MVQGQGLVTCGPRTGTCDLRTRTRTCGPRTGTCDLRTRTRTCGPRTGTCDLRTRTRTCKLVLEDKDFPRGQQHCCRITNSTEIYGRRAE